MVALTGGWVRDAGPSQRATEGQCVHVTGKSPRAIPSSVSEAPSTCQVLRLQMGTSWSCLLSVQV